MNAPPKVILAPRRSGAAFGGHPWVFRGTIAGVEGSPRTGDEVAVHGGDDRRFIAYGLFHSDSDIAVRLYSWDPALRLTEELFRDRIREAIRVRASMGFKTTDSDSPCRLINSEGDQLSGLTVDRFGDWLVMQLTSAALLTRLPNVGDLLLVESKAQGVLSRGTREAKEKEGLVLEDTWTGTPAPDNQVFIREGELQFAVSLAQGQKTGFYLDQRDNRIEVGKLARGRTVLDLFCYTGGFALHCAKGGAESVVGVDSSEPALAMARSNAERNSLQVEFVKADAFEFLKTQGRTFSLVNVDPPRFATSRAGKDASLRKYFSLNTEAMRVVEPGGLLVSSSCSGRVTPEEWVSLLSSVGRRSKRTVQILEVRGAARDHPFSAHCPDGQYLKCVIARVI